MRCKEPRKIRVLHVVESLGVGGMENGVVNIVNTIDSSAFDLRICCCSRAGVLAGRLRDGVSPVYALGCGDGLNLRAVLPLARLLRKLGTDVVHTHGWGSRSLIGYLGARVARIPFCINGEHGMLHLSRRRQLFAQRCLAHRFDRTLAVSAELKFKIIDVFLLGKDDVTVIANGVDTERFTGNYSTAGLRSELGLPADSLLVGSIASLKQQKNQAILLRAIGILWQRTGSKASVIFVGEGPDRPRLEALTRKLGLEHRVVFLGHREDIPELLSLIDVLVVTSVPHHEGMSNVILEAMSSGRAVISSRSVGAGELISEGETGLLFDHEQPEQLADHLSRLEYDSVFRRRLGESARRQVLARHSLEHMVRQYEEFYRGLTGGCV
ncbi:MAG: glycosyltransferase [Candidatus Geothermincolia bacterium]